MALWLMPVRLETAYEKGVVTLTIRTGPVPVKLLPRERAKKLERQGERETEALWRRYPRPVLKLLAQRLRVSVGGDGHLQPICQNDLPFRCMTAVSGASAPTGRIPAGPPRRFPLTV